ncbi:MAG TPA: hypothetical protein PLW92_10415 [Chitinophagales bacterium]|nr:hypothetical protein [Chitinophagales bacterium]HMY43463.1 hypothetical protein [Chitinophagales bacterium]HMZ95018.1 hypothetical protein [Chitinophagales bacterium]HNJ60545.1 hypothetical protein [Chitinophagales bacterium]HNK90592.1 hypothetical protein [Chitinophagales bacterium]
MQKYVEDPLAEEILQNKIQNGDTILVDTDKEDKEKLTFSVKSKKKKQIKEEK